MKSFTMKELTENKGGHMAVACKKDGAQPEIIYVPVDEEDPDAMSPPKLVIDGKNFSMTGGIFRYEQT